MTQAEYEHSKQRLEEQRRAGVELVERAYEAQMRALELVWMLQGGTVPAALPAETVAAVPPAPPGQPRGRKGPEVEEAVYSQFWKLPEVFTRRDVCRILGYEPDRAVLHRVLKKLLRDGFTSLEFKGDGQRPAKYRKTGKEKLPTPCDSREPSRRVRLLSPGVRPGLSRTASGSRVYRFPLASVQEAERHIRLRSGAFQFGFASIRPGFAPDCPADSSVRSAGRMSARAGRMIRPRICALNPRGE